MSLKESLKTILLAPPAYSNKISLDDLINAESAIGRTLFGPIPAGHQREFFESEIGSQRLLFVSRYPQSTDLRSWLQNIPNRYIHFGDFDLAGIHIFLTEFHKCLGERSSFFIPSDIEQRLEYGSTIRYDAQYSKFHTLKCDVQNLQLLIDLINKYHRCYDQEGYILK